ncbi:BTAD domain-containing putative transcriptional regulator [Actinophytocola sp.]|uniref:BTAD domain-containing putative transcriptional regulator n=1 Tax=Actinophytocola sp. TaxID=1872138 RepID=UPI00389984FA
MINDAALGPQHASRRQRVPARPDGLIHRETPLAKLATVSASRVAHVVAPAGAGKSVLLRQHAARTGNPLVSTGGDGSAAGFAARVAAALGGTGTDVAAVLDLLADAEDGPVVVHVDDADHLSGTQAQCVLAELVEEAPSSVSFVLAGRDGGLPVRGGLAAPRVDYADLRMRTWEIEELFRTVYRVRLSPDSAAALCTRVEGLPIAIRLMHLETVLMSGAERAAAFARPAVASARITEFLTTRVLEPLPARLREFMTGVAPLGLLDPALCDLVLDRDDSAEALAELAARQAFTFPVAGQPSTYRFHVLLQQFLEQRLPVLLGAQLTRRAYRTAAVHLSDAGHWPESFRSHARADDWLAASAVLHRFSAHPSGLGVSSQLPAILFEDDPLVALADARRLRGLGRFSPAFDRYLDAEDRLTDPRLRWQCSLERSAVATWLGSGDRVADPLVDDVSAYIAEAGRSSPARLLARGVPALTPAWTMARMVAGVLDGDPELVLTLAKELPADRTSFVPLAGEITAAAVAAMASGTGSVAQFVELATAAERTGWMWLARLARAAMSLVDGDRIAEAEAVLDECRDSDDDWGALIAGFVLTIARLRFGPDALDVLLFLLDLTARHGMRVPQTWFTKFLCGELARLDDPRLAAYEAELARLLTDPALRRTIRHHDSLLVVFRAPILGTPAVAAVEPSAAPVTVRCLGAFTITVAGTDLDLGGLRAQARRVLRVLAMNYGQPVHDERLVTALWPDSSLKQAKHRLHVAISSLRTLLRDRLDGTAYGVVRHGSAYLLRLPPGSTVDHVEFAEAVDRWRTSRSTAAGQEVLDLYGGELLAEEGPAEWVLARREALRSQAVGVAVALARAALDRDDAAAAVAACERALAIDELDTRIWQLMSEARDRAGSHAAALRTRLACQALLADEA